MIDLNRIQQELQLKNSQALAGVVAAEVPAAESPAVEQPAEGQGRAAMKMQLEEELKQWKNRCASLAAERELALALSGQALLPGVAGQLLQLLRGRVVAEPAGHQAAGFEVKSADGRPIGDAVTDWLKSPEFQHFRPAVTRGGTATRNETAHAAGVTGASAANPPKSLNEMVIHQWRQRSGRPSQGEQAGAWPNR